MTKFISNMINQSHFLPGMKINLIYFFLPGILFGGINLAPKEGQFFFENRGDAINALQNLNIPEEQQNDNLPDGVHFPDDNGNQNDQVNIIDNPVVQDPINDQTTTNSLQQLSIALADIDTDDDVPTLQLILGELKILNGENDNVNQGELPPAENNDNANNFVQASDTSNLFPTASPLSSVTASQIAPIFSIEVPKIGGENSAVTKQIDFSQSKFSRFLEVGKILLTAYVCWGIFQRTWQTSIYLVSV